jgi:putative membrane protein insertion efficiency factor
MLFQSFATRALRAYKQFISPLLLSSCRFTPTCSEYAIEAVERHGIFFGGLLSAWRILRCNPFSHGGLDTVPMNLFSVRPFAFAHQRETRNQKLETEFRKT